MHVEDDLRLWVDRVQGREQFGVFTDQKFYSVEYTGDARDDVIAIMAIIEVYNNWCRDCFLAARAGLSMPEFPEALRFTPEQTEEEAPPEPPKRRGRPPKNAKTKQDES